MMTLLAAGMVALIIVSGAFIFYSEKKKEATEKFFGAVEHAKDKYGENVTIIKSERKLRYEAIEKLNQELAKIKPFFSLIGDDGMSKVEQFHSSNGKAVFVQYSTINIMGFQYIDSLIMCVNSADEEVKTIFFNDLLKAYEADTSHTYKDMKGFIHPFIAPFFPNKLINAGYHFNKITGNFTLINGMRGCGKSVLLYQLGIDLARDGYTVYKTTHNELMSMTDAELDQFIAKQAFDATKKYVFIVDELKATNSLVARLASSDLHSWLRINVVATTTEEALDADLESRITHKITLEALSKEQCLKIVPSMLQVDTQFDETAFNNAKFPMTLRTLSSYVVQK